MEVPGIKSDQVDISVVGTSCRSRSIARRGAEGVTYHRRERPSGSFGRTLTLRWESRRGSGRAETRDGVLTITLPKAASAKPRKNQPVAGNEPSMNTS